MGTTISIDDAFDAWCDTPGDLHALAARLQLTPSGLYRLISAPEFQDRTALWSAANHQREADQEAAQDAADRRIAARALRDAVSAPDSTPLERRRAATSLARLAARRTANPAPRPGPRPTPRAAPNPEPDHRLLMRALADALLHEGSDADTSSSLLHIQRQLAPDAAIDHHPAPADPETFITSSVTDCLADAAAIDHLEPAADPPPSDTAVAYSLTLTTQGGSKRPLSFTLARPSPHHPWLIQSITSQPP